MEIYMIITLFIIISLAIAVPGITFVAVKPVVAASHDNDYPDTIYRIDRTSGLDKVIEFDSLDDCHDYIEHHPKLGLSFDDCTKD
jgi:hypothetical protein